MYLSKQPNQTKNMKPYNNATTLSDTDCPCDLSKLAARRAREFAAGNTIEIEVKGSESSEFAWFKSRSKAHTTYAQAIKTLEDDGYADEIELRAIRILGSGQYGEHDANYDEDITPGSEFLLSNF